MARRTKKEAEETRTSILLAALDFFYEKGYARSTFVDIADQIKLSKGAVYWHFKSKPELFIALAAHMEERINEAMQPLYNQTYTVRSLKVMLYEMIRVIVKDAELRKYYAIVFFRMEWTQELISVRDYFDRQDEIMLEFVTSVFQHGQRVGKISRELDCPTSARSLLCLLDGLLGHCLVKPGEDFDSLSDMVQIGLDTFFSGLDCSK